MSFFSLKGPDTLKSFLVRKRSPFLYSAKLNHSESTFCNKIVRGNFYVMGFNFSIGVFLAIVPESVSHWNKKEKFQISAILHQYHESYTKPPVIDKDLLIINYVGHPYQGSFYYNSVRSQGVNAWQSSLFCLGESVLWEYGWEAGLEQPSVQDLIISPLGGLLIGELSHVATIKMSKSGFKWYEVVLVCIINPAYAINSKFKFERPSKRLIFP
jgi:hypothetical protein